MSFRVLLEQLVQTQANLLYNTMNAMLSDPDVDQDLLTQCRDLIVRFMDGTCPTQGDVRTQMYSQASASEPPSGSRDATDAPDDSLSLTRSFSSPLDSFNLVAGAMKVSASCIHIASLDKSSRRLSKPKADEDLSSEVLMSESQSDSAKNAKDTREATSSTNNASYEHLDIVPFESAQ